MELSTQRDSYEFKFFCPERHTIESLTADVMKLYKAIVEETKQVPNLTDIQQLGTNLMKYGYIERLALGKEKAYGDFDVNFALDAYVQEICESFGEDSFEDALCYCMNEINYFGMDADMIESFLSDILYIFNYNHLRYHNTIFEHGFNRLLLTGKMKGVLDAEGVLDFEVNNPILEVW